MFCKNCGKQLEDNNVVCSECGTQVSKAEENNSVTPTSSDVLAQTVVSETPKKKFFSSPLITIAVIALAVIIVFSNLASLGNNFTKLVKSPEKYFAHVVNSNLDDYVDTFAESLSIYTDGLFNGTAADANVSFKVDEELYELLDDIIGEDVSENLDWLEDAGISFNVNSKDSKSNFDVELKVNGVNLGTADFILDPENEKLYIGLTDYNSDYLASEYYGGSIDEEMLDIIKALPKESKVKKLLKKYLKIIADSVNDVSESSSEIEAEGISQKVTELYVDVDGELIKNICLNFMKEFTKDKEIKKIVKDIANANGLDEEDFWDDMDSLIEEMEDSDADDLDNELDNAKFTIYVDNKGQIVGIKFKNDYSKFTCITTQKGNKFGFSTQIKSYDQTAFKVEGTGKVSGSKRSGEFDVSVSGIKILNLKLDKINLDLFKDGILNGKITMSLPEDTVDLLDSNFNSYSSFDFSELSDLSLVINSKTKSLDKSKTEIVINFKDKSLAKIKIDSDLKKPKNVKIPGDYISTEDYDEIEEWASEFNISKLIKKLDKANFPDEIIESLEDALEF